MAESLRTKRPSGKLGQKLRAFFIAPDPLWPGSFLEQLALVDNVLGRRDKLLAAAKDDPNMSRALLHSADGPRFATRMAILETLSHQNEIVIPGSLGESVTDLSQQLDTMPTAHANTIHVLYHFLAYLKNEYAIELEAPAGIEPA